MRVGQRGMFGPEVERGTPIEQAVDWYPLEAMLEGPGIVDYVVGAGAGAGRPSCSARTITRSSSTTSTCTSWGEGPLYCFYTPLPPLPLRGTQHHRPRRAL